MPQRHTPPRAGSSGKFARPGGAYGPGPKQIAERQAVERLLIADPPGNYGIHGITPWLRKHNVDGPMYYWAADALAGRLPEGAE